MSNEERELLRDAIIAAIIGVGLDAFKRTSLFMSNRRKRHG